MSTTMAYSSPYLVEIFTSLFTIPTVVILDALKQVKPYKQHLLFPPVSLKLLGGKRYNCLIFDYMSIKLTSVIPSSP